MIASKPSKLAAAKVNTSEKRCMRAGQREQAEVQRAGRRVARRVKIVSISDVNRKTARCHLQCLIGVRSHSPTSRLSVCNQSEGLARTTVQLARGSARCVRG